MKHKHLYEKKGSWMHILFKDGSRVDMGPMKWYCECGKEKERLTKGDKYVP